MTQPTFRLPGRSVVHATARTEPTTWGSVEYTALCGAYAYLKDAQPTSVVTCWPCRRKLAKMLKEQP